MDERGRAFASKLYQEHLEEAADLYEQRQVALDDWSICWNDLDYFDDSMEAHIDALIVGGELAREIYEPKAMEGDPGESFVSLALLCRQDQFETVETVIAAHGTKDASKIRASQAALQQTVEFEKQGPWIIALQRQQSCGAVLAGFVGRRRLQGYDHYLRHLLERSDDPEIVFNAVWAIGRVGNRGASASLWPIVESSKDAALRHAAVIALLRVGDTRIREEVASAASSGILPLSIWSLCAGPSDVDLILAIACSNKEPDSITALGLLGDVRSIDFLMETLADKAYSASAAQSLRLILGAEPVETLVVPDDAGYEGEEMDAELAPPPDRIKRLSQNPEDWIAWWHDHGRTFQIGRRYRLGEAYSPGALVRSLEGDYPKFIRQFVHEEIIIRYREDQPFETDLPVAQQRAAIAKWKGWVTANEGRFKPGEWYLGGQLIGKSG